MFNSEETRRRLAHLVADTADALREDTGKGSSYARLLALGVLRGAVDDLITEATGALAATGDDPEFLAEVLGEGRAILTFADSDIPLSDPDFRAKRAEDFKVRARAFADQAISELRAGWHAAPDGQEPGDTGEPPVNGDPLNT